MYKLYSQRAEKSNFCQKKYPITITLAIGYLKNTNNYYENKPK